jgi:hypothetical protein
MAPPFDHDPARLLPVDMIVSLLPATFEGRPFEQPARPPTGRSVRRIERELNVVLPELLLTVARANGSYGYWFASLGEDYRNGNHILRVNRWLRETGVPPHLVVFGRGFDGECDAWDLSAGAAEPMERPIVTFYDEDGASKARSHWPGFHAYMDWLCRNCAPSCPIDDVRQRARDILTGRR